MSRIEFKGYVKIGGIDQWIQYGGDHSQDPILLFVHGGPGASSRICEAAWRPWEAHFTVVHWDQRGAGLTLEQNGPEGCGTLSLARMKDDLLELADHLEQTIGQKRIVLMGHSWGSILCINAIKTAPRRFAAYIGTGQAVDMARNETRVYEKTMARAKTLQNQDARDALNRLGPPPYRERDNITALRGWADRLADGDGDALTPKPEPLPADRRPDGFAIVMRGIEFSRRALHDDVFSADLPALGLDFEIPMFLFHGTDDPSTPFDLAEAYFAQIRAPHKAVVPFPGCHHFVAMNRPLDILTAMKIHVLAVLNPPRA